MPLKVMLEVALIALMGAGLGLWLLVRRKALLFSLFVGLALLVSYVFLPCFNPFGEIVCHGPRSQKRIALTFDDGPNEPYTSQILDILGKEQVPATFFVVGKNVLRHPDVVRRMVQEGYVVGNHTWDHKPLVLTSSSEIRSEVERWEKAMSEIGLDQTFASPKLFRAPHGWKTPLSWALLRDKGYQWIGWSCGIWDSDRPGRDVLMRRLTKRVGPGDILLLHDGGEDREHVDRSQTVDILPEIIEFYRSRGYRFVTLQDLLGSGSS